MTDTSTLERPRAATGTSLALASDELAERMLHRRAVDAVVWGMPAVNTDLMFQAMAREVGGKWNQIVYWSRLLDWKNQTLTPNPDSVYIMPFFNTAEAGPMVIEIPPANGGSITGSIMDTWQTPLEDVGPAGVDSGKGGKYLILAPGHDGTVPDGYITLPCQTYQGYALLRSILKSGSADDFATAIDYGKRIKFYPLSQADNPPETVWLDAADVVFDATIPYDVRFFESLARIVDSQPWLERDRAMIDPLRTLGIEKGKTFQPDARTREVMNEAAQEAHQWLDVQYETLLSPPFYDGTHWALPAAPKMLEAMQSFYADPNEYPVDSRGAIYGMVELTADRLVLVENGAAVDYPGSIDDYIDFVLGRNQPRAEAKPKAGKSDRRAAAKARDGASALKRAASDAEAESARLAAQCSAIDRAMFDPAGAEPDLASLPMSELSRRRAKLETELALAEARWLEASEQLESLAA